jgi:quercetin dioxygenase-like cupin family protein
MNTTENENALFPLGEPTSPDYFTGNAWWKPLMTNAGTFNVLVGHAVFEPGARNNWHTHPGGQILIVTDGIGYYQEMGKPIQLLRKGDVVPIAPEVKHWHGATPNSSFTHIAISTNTNKGIVDWLEPVTNEQYNNV